MAGSGTLDEGLQLGNRKGITRKNDPDTVRNESDATELELQEELHRQRTGFHSDMDALMRGMEGHML